MKRPQIIFVIVLVVLFSIVGLYGYFMYRAIYVPRVAEQVIKRGSQEYYLMISDVLKEFPVIERTSEDEMFFYIDSDEYWLDNWLSYESSAKIFPAMEKADEHMRSKGFEKLSDEEFRIYNGWEKSAEEMAIEEHGHSDTSYKREYPNYVKGDDMVTLSFIEINDEILQIRAEHITRWSSFFRDK